MQMRPLGSTGLVVSTVGYGAPFLSVPGHPQEADAIELLHQLIARGVTFIDTADTYCARPSELHHNERLIARAIQTAPRSPCVPICVATKGGTVRTESGWEIDGAPDRLYRGICESYQALGGAQPITLWQHHWPDERHPVRAVMQAAGRAVDEGLLRFVGVSNYSLQQLREARETINVVCVQNQYNLWNRDAEYDGLLEYCEQHDIVFLPWRPMGGTALVEHLHKVKLLNDLARDRGISPQRLMIAWQLAKSRCILPIPGSRKLSNILDCLAAADFHLDASEIARLDTISPSDGPDRARRSAWRGGLLLSSDTRSETS